MEINVQTLGAGSLVWRWRAVTAGATRDAARGAAADVDSARRARDQAAHRIARTCAVDARARTLYLSKRGYMARK